MAHKLRADEIERLMLGKQLNKTQLARAAKISVRTLNRWLGGEAASMDGLLLLAKALGVEAGSLKAGEQVVPNPNIVPRASITVESGYALIEAHFSIKVCFSPDEAPPPALLAFVELLQKSLPDKDSIEVKGFASLSVV